MPVAVRPMSEPEFTDRIAAFARRYAEAIVLSGAVAPAEAADRAGRLVADLLPDGRRTEGMLFLLGEAAAGAGFAPRPVGWLWLRLPSGSAAGTGRAWVFEIFVEPAERGRGQARAMADAARAELARRGVRTVGAQVFGHNVVSAGLAEALGFRVVSQVLEMEVTPPPR